jgi:hypothetical protein
VTTNLFPIGSAQNGPQLTVNDILKDPAVVPLRILAMLDQMFIADQLLRKGPMADAGVVKFHQSTPLFAATSTALVGEFGEIPVGVNEIGALLLTQTNKRGLGVRISVEMANRNNIDAVNLQITQVRNTMVRDWDAVFMAALLAAASGSGHGVAASVDWSQSTASTRKDIAEAIYQVVSSQAPNTTDGDEFMGFKPDTLVLNIADVVNMVGNDDTWKAFVGNVADQSTAVTGKLPNRLFGLDVWQTWHVPAGTALVLERQTVGFISDERPLQATPTRWIPDNESWRSDCIRQSAIGIDQPLAVCPITGIAP